MIHKFKQGDMYFVLDVNSGAVHVIDEIVFDALEYYPQNNAVSVVRMLKDKYPEAAIKETLDELDYLIDNDMLFTDDTYVNSIEFNNRSPIIKALCLHVAHDCNIRCAYCFASQGDFKGDRSLMPFEVGKKALDLLVANSGNRRNLEVDFFGGEPLMNFEVVKQLVNYGRSLEAEHNKNFRFTITTNGVLLNDDNMAYINENMSNVVLSIDGRKEVNDKMRYTISGGGTYDIIIEKFKKLIEKREGKSYYVRGTFTKNNLDFSNDVIHLADLGFKSTSVEPVVAKPTDSYAITEEHIAKLNSEYEALAEEMVARHNTDKEFSFFHFAIDMSQGPCVVKRLSGCGAGSEYLAITPEGDIFPCHQFVGDDNFKMGNVLAGVLDFGLTNQFKNAHVYNKEKCRSCWAKFYCSGGCHANAYNFNHDIFVPYDIGCELEKKRIESSIYIYGKLNHSEE
ncbi:thioether cross-link-forming SCIFF peptide maturase [Fusibacter bizertensis]|jgi:Arylsulfatase regulator (Fe-S oxidoreductase)|uniref:Thioether cross-link-forming SCIFF peptide maturase n=1 Tax=Fusibacter bizertensis TaxID=1488331 RepID=A0ABT6N9P8_9FIRM|nr:thioether cross-link-forming SCIFF peptide maturase [Fusibacter bizertensis]MDH8677140.1 thioether cross-link-forming SCIFF peptide maturase [Fusibacter bizertensis]